MSPAISNIFSEKIILFIEYLQIISVICNSTYTWPIYFKYQFTPYIQFINLDIYPYVTSSLASSSTSINVSSSTFPTYWYWIYASSITIISFIIMILSDTIRKYQYCLSNKKYIEKIETIRSKYELYTYRFCRLFIIPSLQITLRLFQCKNITGIVDNVDASTAMTDDNAAGSNNATSSSTTRTIPKHVVYIDHTIECYSYQHFIRAGLIIAPLFIAFLVYLLTYFERINQSLITDYDENVHMKHLRSRKLEYILKLSNTFYDSGIYLTEHLHFYHLYNIILWNIVKLIIVSIYILFESYNMDEYNKTRTYIVIITTFLILLLHVVWSIHIGGYLPYRSPSINVLWFNLNLTLLLIFGFTILRHDINIIEETGAKQSIFTIDTFFTMLLQYTSIVGLLFAMVASDFIRMIPPLHIFGYNKYYHQQKLQNTEDTYGIKFDYGNKVGKNKPYRGCRGFCLFIEPLPCCCNCITRKIYLYEANVNGWVQAIRDSQDLLYNSLTCPIEMIPIHKLKQSSKILKRCLEEANNYGHGYPGHGSDTKGHLLRMIIQETLEEIMSIFVIYKRKSLLPNYYLEGDNMIHVKRVLKHRHENMILVDPRLKGVLNKLLAIRAWQSQIVKNTKRKKMVGDGGGGGDVVDGGGKEVMMKKIM